MVRLLWWLVGWVVAEIKVVWVCWEESVVAVDCEGGGEEGESEGLSKRRAAVVRGCLSEKERTKMRVDGKRGWIWG